MTTPPKKQLRPIPDSMVVVNRAVLNSSVEYAFALREQLEVMREMVGKHIHMPVVTDHAMLDRVRLMAYLSSIALDQLVELLGERLTSEAEVPNV